MSTVFKRFVRPLTAGSCAAATRLTPTRLRCTAAAARRPFAIAGTRYRHRSACADGGRTATGPGRSPKNLRNLNNTPIFGLQLAIGCNL